MGSRKKITDRSVWKSAGYWLLARCDQLIENSRQ
jgi:hypothetical protein